MSPHPRLQANVAHRPLALAVALGCLLMAAAQGQDLESSQQQLIRGEYEKVIDAAKSALKEKPDDAGWSLVLGRALMETGRYTEARDVFSAGVSQTPLDLSLRLAAYEAARAIGKTEVAQMELSQMDQLGGSISRSLTRPSDRIALGRVALLAGGDPKRVLDVFFDPVQKEEPNLRDTYLASGRLALDKNDFALAAKTFAPAVKKFPEDPDLWFGLAQAYVPSDTEQCLEAIKNTLTYNPHHVRAYLLLAEHHIDSEHYPEADTAIAEALKTNPNSPEAHALRAVLAHLRADTAGELSARAAALKAWPENPAVPYLIGRKLSQKYRFAEGSELQRSALKFDPNFLPAKAQLANDLLRLGDAEQGWKLAEEVQQADPYDVVAYNLVTLRDAIKNFRTLESEHFSVRMDPREAGVYGDGVLSLLERAHATLTKKYGLPLKDKTIVEIFPDQKDFAIRTFGLPGGAGYLGVCFGRVITANSPAARPGSTASWEAVLWHEFCHVVTLTLTKNKMPRWLSEGISVFEERQARGNWGEQMKPRYRAMILGEDLTPVSQLSGAFLRPKTPAHLGFAYYESSLVVEWLIERWGIDKMKRALADLAKGTEINAALAAHFAPIDKLDAEFATHARALASNTGAKLDWTKPTPADLASAPAVENYLKEKPNNFNALLDQAQRLLLAKKWKEAKTPLEKLIELYPDQREADSAYSLLARAQRELGETDAEIATLAKLADLASDAVDAFERLTQLFAERKDWSKVVDYASRYTAVNPLNPEPHRLTAQAQEELKHRKEAIEAYSTLLALNPANPADVHFHLARLLHEDKNPSAKRHVLLALEEAPRFRAAQRLLLEIAGKPSDSSRVKVP
jgi:tetratricopeptide (TPR) repeat protein